MSENQPTEKKVMVMQDPEPLDPISAADQDLVGAREVRPVTFFDRDEDSQLYDFRPGAQPYDPTVMERIAAENAAEIEETEEDESEPETAGGTSDPKDWYVREPVESSQSSTQTAPDSSDENKTPASVEKDSGQDKEKSEQSGTPTSSSSTPTTPGKNKPPA